MKQKYLSALLVLALLLALAPAPARAYVSDRDRDSGIADAIEKATKDYNDAKARGDKEGMEKAHQDAENARNNAGYSGGSDGTGSSSSGKSSGGSSSSSSDRDSGGSSSSGKSSTVDVAKTTQQMADNSAAWYVAKSEYDAAVASGNSVAAAKAQSTMNKLHDENTKLANDIAGKNGSVTYDAETGVTTIKTGGGQTITNANGVTNNGSTTTMVYQISNANGGNGGSAASSQYSDAGIAAYIKAGGTVEGLIDSYNQRAKEVAQSGDYGDQDSRLSISEEIAIVKQWYPNLSQSKINTLKNELTAAKEAYENARDAYNNATTDAEREAARAAMQAANERAEAARGKVGYSGNSKFWDDGGFFDPEMQVSSSGGAPAKDGTAVVEFSKSYAIVAKAVGGGSISPDGTSYVAEGKSKAYTMMPNDGWMLMSVTVDGKNVGTPATYTFENVTAAHTITATFVEKGVVSTGDLVLEDSLGVSLYSSSIKSGYGIFATLRNVSTKNVKDVGVVLTYDFGAGKKTVKMVSKGSDFILPVNSASPTKARCVYIPVETKDGSYTLTATATATDVNTGETLTSTAKGAITVKGSMYEDDFTGNASKR